MIILISGKMGSGKTTLAKELIQEMNGRHFKFADALYEMHDAIGEVAENYEIPFDQKEGTLLQLLGTEWGRKVKGQDVWVNALKHRVAMSLQVAPNMPIIIDDCRFPNELLAFPSAIKIKLFATKEARKARADAWRENDTHESETALDNVIDSAFDLVIDTSLHSKQYALDVVVKYLRGLIT